MKNGKSYKHVTMKKKRRNHPSGNEDTKTKQTSATKKKQITVNSDDDDELDIPLATLICSSKKKDKVKQVGKFKTQSKSYDMQRRMKIKDNKKLSRVLAKDFEDSTEDEYSVKDEIEDDNNSNCYPDSNNGDEHIEGEKMTNQRKYW
jgi:hypothetical protein